MLTPGSDRVARVALLLNYFNRFSHFNKILLLLLLIVIVFPSHILKEWSSFSDDQPFEKYTETIPGSDVSFDMMPIAGGSYLMGSPAQEKNRGEGEGPQVKVEIAPFWMASHETTWDMFEIFMFQEQEKRLAEQNGGLEAANIPPVDAVSRPTPPYLDMSFGMGKYGYPAICMTQYSAQMFCKWLSAKTGVFYRLPTEAEWEYACRAGTNTAYFFGDDASQLEEYAWFYDNTNGGYEKVGGKKPNPWGLYDMHGNVAEWTLDQYDAEFYQLLKSGAANPWNKPETLYPRTTRGGSWYDDPEMLRSAARLPSNPRWKQQDPQIPKSNWWHTDARFVGFRVIRPLVPPSGQELQAFWPQPIEDL
ncbi:MAG: formylglycine-generating enzyme family protein [Cyclobacteriaceae bacterium]